ncbi:MAG: TRAP transporter small permease [Thermodesulfobacteriota bacterium]
MIKNLLNRVEEAFICLLLAAMTIEVFIEVILRYVFNTGVSFGTELTQHLSAWMVLFGASYGVKVGSHIGVDAFVRTLPSVGRRAVSAFAILLALVYCGLIIYGSWGYLAKVYKVQLELQDMPIQRWIAHSPLVLGYAMLAFRLIALLGKILSGRAEGFKLVDEAKESMKMYVKKAGADEAGEGGKA